MDRATAVGTPTVAEPRTVSLFSPCSKAACATRLVESVPDLPDLADLLGGLELEGDVDCPEKWTFE